MSVVVAKCERCGGQWSVVHTNLSPKLLEGICMDCQEDSDAEKPLTFALAPSDYATGLPELPKEWLA